MMQKVMAPWMKPIFRVKNAPGQSAEDKGIYPTTR